MGLFGFGKKKERSQTAQPAPKAKTDAELCDEGARAYREKNYAAAAQIWLSLAEKGMARAQDCTALLYYRGDGVEKDEKKAAEWYRKAAEQGFASSCFNLAVFYEHGVGVTKDLNEALRWAEKAKALGSEKADNLIAEIRHNIEVEKNRENLTKPSEPDPGEELSPEERYQKGMELFRAGDYDGAYALLRRVCRCFGAQKNDYPDGQAAMGWMHEHGRGVEGRDLTAYLHYKIAAQNGSKDGMAGVVRLTVKKEAPSVSECQRALDYARQLDASEAKEAVPALEQKLLEAQKREKIDEMIKDFRKLSDIERKNLADDWLNMTLSQKFAYKKVLGQSLEDLSQVVDNPETQEKIRWMAQEALTFEERYYGALKSFQALSKEEQVKWIEDILGKELSFDEQKNLDLEKLFAGFLS